MRKIISEHDKTLAIALSIALVGVYGCLIDYYNGEEDIFPRILTFSFLDEKFTYQLKGEQYGQGKIVDRYVTINSVWFLFIIFGIMFFYVELYDVKSPILIYGIPILLFHYIKLKIIDNKIAFYKYLIK